VLAFFKTSSAEYSCIFTPGATGALKLLGEVFPWTSQSEFCYTVENHNSVLGMREYALEKGATACAVDTQRSQRMDLPNAEGKVWNISRRQRFSRIKHVPEEVQSHSGQEHPPEHPEAYHLFGCPVECNFSGVKLDLNHVEEIQKGHWSGKR
jgi:molybdenum cofactor sulfurtransferase